MRIFDSAQLEKLKQQRACQFKGHDLVPGAPTPKEWEAIERDVASRYPEHELKAMRKHGFSGLSAERRAEQAGLTDIYNIIYRNFSRNVHSIDFSEVLMLNDPSLLPTRRADYFESRNGVACDTAFISAFEIVSGVNAIFRLSFDRRLQRRLDRRAVARAALGW